MKSFRVRLGAGVITIAFAAYVGFNSQGSDDPEGVSESVAGSSLDQVAVDPLSDQIETQSLDSGWLEKPSTPLSASNIERTSDVSDTGLIPAVQQSEPMMGQVQLVQHEEPDYQGGSATGLAEGLPSTLSETKVANPETAWLVPEGDPQVESTGQVGGNFRFPSPGTSEEPAPSNGAILAVPSLAKGQDFSFPTTEADASVIPGDQVDVGQTESGEPSFNFPAADTAPIASSSESISAADTTANQLREDFGAANVLRGDQPPADLGFTVSEEPVVIASSEGPAIEGPAIEVGSGVLGGSVSSGIAVGLPAKEDASRLPGVQEMDSQPVGNGLRSPEAWAANNGAASSFATNSAVGDLSEGAVLSDASDEQNQPAVNLGVGESFGLPQGSPSESLDGSSPSEFADLNESGFQTMPLSDSSALEVASAVPRLGSAVVANSTLDTAGTVGGIAAPTALRPTLDSPGDRRLEGAQTPSVVIQKRAPSEVRVGKPASFVVNVQNVGVAEALNVEVYDRVPAGMRFIEATPAAKQLGGQLMWELGTMQAGEERTITMQLVPEQEGELGSVARVSFEAAASVRTLSTKPELKIVQRVPDRGVLIGQQLEIEIEVSNPGTGSASGVILQEDVPEGLEHPRGRQLDNALGTLAPGEVRRQVLRLRAVKPGVVENKIRLVSDDGLETEHSVAVQVIAPNLQVQLSGPSRRFLERPATYQLQVANEGTADATNLEIAVHLDRGFTFVSTENEGYYDPNRHAVFWSLAQLPAGANGTVPLTLLPVEVGEQAIRIEADGDLGVAIQAQRTMTVEGFAELTFGVSNPGGPIEIGAETEYEVVVTNTGSMADENIRIQVQLPAGLELISTNADAGTNGQGLVAFQAIAKLLPGEMTKQTIRVRGLTAGTHIVQAVVVSDQSTVAVKKEESTRVYSDQ